MKFDRFQLPMAAPVTDDSGFIRVKFLFRLNLHNLRLVRPGISFHEIQDQSYPIPEECQENVYPCIMHGVGMCDEYPRINPAHWGKNPYNGTLEAGMVMTVESYLGPKSDPMVSNLKSRCW